MCNSRKCREIRDVLNNQCEEEEEMMKFRNCNKSDKVMFAEKSPFGQPQVTKLEQQLNEFKAGGYDPYDEDKFTDLQFFSK